MGRMGWKSPGEAMLRAPLVLKSVDMFESGKLETALAFVDWCCVILPYLAKLAS